MAENFKCVYQGNAQGNSGDPELVYTVPSSSGSYSLVKIIVVNATPDSTYSYKCWQDDPTHDENLIVSGNLSYLGLLNGDGFPYDNAKTLPLFVLNEHIGLYIQSVNKVNWHISVLEYTP